MMRLIEFGCIAVLAVGAWSSAHAQATEEQSTDASPHVTAPAELTADELTEAANRSYRSGDADTALRLLAEALRLSREALGERHPDTLISLDNHAFLLQELGHAEEAEPLLADLLRLRRQVLGERNSDTLESLTSYALVLQELGRADEALPLLAEKLRLYREVLGERHPGTLQILSDYALLLQSLGHTAEAEPLLAEALRFSREVLGERVSFTLENLSIYASVLQELGRADEAEPLFAEALRLYREELGERHPNTLVSLNNYAQALLTLGRADEAEPLLAEALRLYREVLGERDLETLTGLNNYAAVLQLLGRLDEAEPLYAEALRSYREVLGDQHPDTLKSIDNYAAVLEGLGRAEEAEPLLAGVLRLRRELLGERHPETLNSLNNYAYVLRSLGRADEAEPLLAEALRLRRDVLGERHPDTLTSLNNYAVLLRETGHPAEALPISRELVAATRSRAADLAGHGLRGKGQRGRERIEREQIEQRHADVLWANFAPAQADRADLQMEAFTALQLASAGSTTPAVAEAAATRFAAGAGLQSLAHERKGLVRRWVNLEAELVAAQAGGESAASLRETTRNNLLAVEARIGEIDTRLAAEVPQYFAILNQQATELGQLRTILGEDEAVLFLVPTEHGTHSMVVTRDGFGWSRTGMDEDSINYAVARLRSGLEVDGTGVLPVFDLDRAHALYSELVAPMEPTLQGHATVFVVATGALSRLPLGVLVSSSPTEGANFDDPEVLRSADWLADRYALVQLPSLQSLVFIRSFDDEPGSGDAGFIGFGAPILEGGSRTRGARSATLEPVEAASLTGAVRGANGVLLMDPAALRRLAALPGTRGELEQVRNAVGAHEEAIYLAERMTEPAIRNADLTGTRILHLATHALTSEESGEIAEPGLVFTPPDEALPDNDGYLTASEVIGLDLSSADWVILSACNTASPSSQTGASGLSGLAEAFFYAGARSLLVSHWPVFDDVAPVLTVKVLRGEQQGLSRAEALQAAMRDIRNNADLNASHPAVWAPFVLAGEGA